MQSFTELRVWRHAHEFMLDTYRLTRAFPREELFGMTSQLRRAALSVPANLAEGSKKRSKIDFARFVNIAEASTAELQSLILACRDLKYLSVADAESLLHRADQMARMLARLHRVLESEGRARTSALAPR